MFGVAVYAVSLMDSANAPVPLANVSGGTSFQNFLEDYLSINAYQNIELLNNRMLRIEQRVVTGQSSVIAGYVKTGEFGYESEIYDTESERLSHQRSISEADLIPFMFAFAIPNHGNKCLLLLQRFKQFGVRKFFGSHLESSFSSRFNGLKVEIRRVTPVSVLNTLLSDGIVKSMRFIRYSLPSDIADMVSSGGSNPEDATVEMIVKAKRNKSIILLDGLKQVVLGKRNFSEVAELQNVPFDSLKIEVEFNGKRRTIDIGAPSKFTSNIELDVQEGLNGHPLPKPMFEAIMEIANDVAGAAGLSIQTGSYGGLLERGMAVVNTN